MQLLMLHDGLSLDKDSLAHALKPSIHSKTVTVSYQTPLTCAKRRDRFKAK